MVAIDPSVMFRYANLTCCCFLVACAMAADGPAGPDQDLCGTATTMQGDPLVAGQSGSWSVLAGSGNFLDVNSPASFVDGLSIGENIFTWTLFDNGVPSWDQVIITVFDPAMPSPDAGPDSVLCQPNNNMFLQAAPVEFPVIGSWFVLNGTAIIDMFTDPASEVTIPSVGSATLVWTVYNGVCGETSDEVVISLQECIIGVDEMGDETSPWMSFDQDARRLRLLRAVEAVRVYGADGRTMISHGAVADQGSLDLARLAPGAYVVRSQLGERTSAGRILISH